MAVQGVPVDALQHAPAARGPKSTMGDSEPSTFCPFTPSDAHPRGMKRTKKSKRQKVSQGSVITQCRKGGKKVSVGVRRGEVSPAAASHAASPHPLPSRRVTRSLLPAQHLPPDCSRLPAAPLASTSLVQLATSAAAPENHPRLRTRQPTRE